MKKVLSNGVNYNIYEIETYDLYRNNKYIDTVFCYDYQLTGTREVNNSKGYEMVIKSIEEVKKC